jgi:hypothetical protein
MSKRVRPLGDITTDLEPLLLEMAENHKMQVGEILNIIRGYLEIHCPDAQEVYKDGSRPVFYYGVREGLK